MTYTKRDFGVDLATELDKGIHIDRLSRWAYATYLRHLPDLEDGLIEVMMQIVAMEEGPEFEFAEGELRDLAENLSNARG